MARHGSFTSADLSLLKGLFPPPTKPVISSVSKEDARFKPLSLNNFYRRRAMQTRKKEVTRKLGFIVQPRLQPGVRKVVKARPETPVVKRLQAYAAIRRAEKFTDDLTFAAHDYATSSSVLGGWINGIKAKAGDEGNTPAQVIGKMKPGGPFADSWQGMKNDLQSDPYYQQIGSGLEKYRRLWENAVRFTVLAGGDVQGNLARVQHRLADKTGTLGQEMESIPSVRKPGETLGDEVRRMPEMIIRNGKRGTQLEIRPVVTRYHHEPVLSM